MDGITSLAYSADALQERRERVFLLLAGFFLCAMTLLNVIGITRFVQLGTLQLAVGVLAYPLTFFCTDIISELYGKARANFVVTVGLVLNAFIFVIMYLANSLPAVPPNLQPSWQTIELANEITLADNSRMIGSVELFNIIYACTTGAILASMLAYIAAQYIDVFLFHWLKKLTAGKHMWIRNNCSTLTSQAVDSIMVISITFGASVIAGDMTVKVVLSLMLSNYLFKMLAALIDTPFIYLAVNRLRPYLRLQQ